MEEMGGVRSWKRSERHDTIFTGATRGVYQPSTHLALFDLDFPFIAFVLGIYDTTNYPSFFADIFWFCRCFNNLHLVILMSTSRTLSTHRQF